MKFDVEKYVFENLENPKKGSTGQISATCPFCEKYGSFYIDVEKGNYICFKCEERGYYLVGVIARVEGITWAEAKKFLFKNLINTRRKETIPSLLYKIRNLREGKEPKEVEKVVELPKDFIPVYKKGKWKFPKYLKKRGIKKNTAKVWGIGFCNNGRYKNRIIIPIKCLAGESFTSRDVTGLLKPKYLNPPCSFQSHLLLGWEHIKNGDLVLVEGPIDAIKMWQHGFNTLALSGKILHKKQLRTIFNLPRDTSITIMLDPEEASAPFDVAKQLIFRFDKIYISTLPSGVDPGSSTKGQAEKAIEDAVVYRGERGKSLAANIALLREKVCGSRT